MLPPLEQLPEEEQERFRRVYCGLCHTLGERYGLAARFILNYDFTFLALLLSAPEEAECRTARCPASPLRKKCFRCRDRALETAAGESVILAYWQLRDGVSDHGFFRGLKYRTASRLLARAYRRAAASLPEFDASARRQLARLGALERERCASLDAPADAFAQLLAAAAEAAENEVQRRILRQLLYHLGRWVYLVDAADDLKRDARSGNYNPLILRFRLTDGTLDTLSRKAFTSTLDHSVRLIAAAYELWDFGCWSPLLESTIYTGLFQVGKSVLDGTFRTRRPGRPGKRKKIVEETA